MTIPPVPKPAFALAAAGLLAAGLAAPAARATVFSETEPNDSKAAANAFSVVSGDQLTGSSTGTSITVAGATSADYYRLNFAAPTVPGIYRQQIALTGGFSGTLRGLSQNTGVIGTADAQVQATTATTGNLNQLYTFGGATSVYYRVTGATATTTPYFATLTTTLVTPTVVTNIFQAGNLTISSVGQTTADTDFWIYDANLRPIPGYGGDDVTGASGQGTLTASFAAGTYYVAMSDFNLANDQASPASDNFRSGNVLDFAGALMDSSAETSLNTSFTITDASGNPVAVSVTKAGAFDVNFIQFTVAPIPEPSTYALALLGGAGLFGAVRRGRAARLRV